MKYYSDLTRKVYDTTEELEKAEKALTEKKNAREARAKEVEDAMEAAREANDHAKEVLAQFCKDYGSYHKTITKASDISPFSWFEDFFFNL